VGQRLPCSRGRSGSRRFRESTPRRRRPACQAARRAGGLHHVPRGRLPQALRRRAPRQDGRVPSAPGERRVARGAAVRGVRRGPRGTSARVRPAHVRRSADGRHRPPRGRHRRDEDRRGKDVRRLAAAVPERPAGGRRPPGHGQRLPGEARRRVEPRRVRAAGDDGRVDREHAPLLGAQSRLRVRRHLRDELRVRLRLPPRQHGRLTRAVRPAQPLVRDRGRGRLDPRRRGAHAADHLRRARDRGAGVRRLRAHRPDADRVPPAEGAAGRRPRRGSDPGGNGLSLRREVQDRRPTRAGDREVRARSTTRATSSSSTT
jgi:hypothetical protein